jgi:hypothetical protein
VSPTVTHPWERPVPGASECTTAKPRGTHVRTSWFEMRVRVESCGGPSIEPRGGEGSPSSWRTFQNADVRATPAK